MAKLPPMTFVGTPWSLRRDELALTGAARWYLVQTLPKREAQAEFQLLAQNFRVYLPRLTKTNRHARQLRAVRVPVFPGYLFVILELGRDQWRSINGTIGVARIVTCDSRPSPVPPGLVETMLEQTDEEGDMNLAIPSLTPGQSVRVIAGPFAQFVGILDRLDASGRVRVLLEVMGGVIPLLLAKDALEPTT